VKHFVFALLMFSALPTWAACAGLQIENAWVRAAPPGANMMAGYATVKNTGTKTRTLGEVRSKDFDAIEVHKTVLEGGVSKMIYLETVEVAAGGSAQFEPGGMHLMLFKPKRALKAGDTLQLAFSCGGKKRLKASFVVKDAP
jgi:copper(I)-binding protein